MKSELWQTAMNIEDACDGLDDQRVSGDAGMTALTLYAHEVRRLLAHGSVLLMRPVKPQPPAGVNMIEPWNNGRWELSIDHFDGTGELVDDIGCSFGVPGTEHWVRETWVYLEPEHGIRMHVNARLLYRVLYRADGDNPLVSWRSPITMPRWASRCNVTVRNVWVVRVEELSAADLASMGVQERLIAKTYQTSTYYPAENVFMDYWDTRYGKQYPYAANPYAWVVTIYRTRTDRQRRIIMPLTDEIRLDIAQQAIAMLQAENTRLRNALEISAQAAQIKHGEYEALRAVTVALETERDALRTQLTESWQPVGNDEMIELEDLPTESIRIVDGHIVAVGFVGDEDDTIEWNVWLPDWLRLCRRTTP